MGLGTHTPKSLVRLLDEATCPKVSISILKFTFHFDDFMSPLYGKSSLLILILSLPHHTHERRVLCALLHKLQHIRLLHISGCLSFLCQKSSF